MAKIQEFGKERTYGISETISSF